MVCDFSRRSSAPSPLLASPHKSIPCICRLYATVDTSASETRQPSDKPAFLRSKDYSAIQVGLRRGYFSTVPETPHFFHFLVCRSLLPRLPHALTKPFFLWGQPNLIPQLLTCNSKFSNLSKSRSGFFCLVFCVRVWCQNSSGDKS